MKPLAKMVPLLALILAAPTLSAAVPTTRLEEFAFQGKPFMLEGSFARGQADLFLRQERDARCLSEGMGGENLLLGVRFGAANVYVFWLNHRQRSVRLAYHDLQRCRSRVLPLPGFSAFGPPEVVEEGGRPLALLFLGDRSGNLDLFHYELSSGALTALTATPYCEKGFTWKRDAAGLEFQTRHLGGSCRYRFDPASQRSTLLSEEKLRPLRHRPTAAGEGDFYNTFVGFGDSITWGQIEAVQRLDLCYLTRMRDHDLALNYGASDFINLGVPGDGTRSGAERVDQDLRYVSAFYFLLMLGVNDVSQAEFSLADSLENIEYIIDAARARDMRVIVSTLTPRRDVKAETLWYWNNLHALSAGILNLAAAKQVASIDALTAFLETNPPDGWKDLLETPGTVVVDGEEVVVKGNHPNGDGHALIASLFAAALVAFPPLPPADVKVLNPAAALSRTATWNASQESDFDHFHIDFGFQDGELPYSVDTLAAFYTFRLFPFLPQLDFRIQTVDRSGHASGFRTPSATAAGAQRPPRAPLGD